MLVSGRVGSEIQQAGRGRVLPLYTGTAVCSFITNKHSRWGREWLSWGCVTGGAGGPRRGAVRDSDCSGDYHVSAPWHCCETDRRWALWHGAGHGSNRWSLLIEKREREGERDAVPCKKNNNKKVSRVMTSCIWPFKIKAHIDFDFILTRQGFKCFFFFHATNRPMKF